MTAHTVRRAVARTPASNSVGARDDISTIAMPRLGRPAGAVTAIPLPSETERTRELRNELAEPKRAAQGGAIGRAMPALERSPAVVEGRPAAIERPPAVIERPPPVIARPPAVIARPPAVIEGPPKLPPAPRTARVYVALPFALLLGALVAGWLWLTLLQR